MSKVRLYHPTTQIELVGALTEADQQTVILAGGTDATLKMRAIGFYEGKLIDLSGMESLKYIRETEREIQIGALATLTMIEESGIVQTFYPVLAKAASVVGSTQIRNVATLPGNLCNASPCADTVPCLMAADAKVKVLNAKGEIKTYAPTEIIHGQGRNLLNPDEVIIEIAIPKKRKQWLHGYRKIGARKTVTIAKLNGCILVNAVFNRIEDVVIYTGSLGIKAFRAELAEEAVRGKCLDEQLSEALYRGLSQTVDASIKERSSYPYKRDAIRGLADDLARQLLEQAEKEVDSNDVEIHREVLSTS